MMRPLRQGIALFVLSMSLFTPLQSWDFFEVTGPHELAMGPEIYQLKRERQGGTFQKGCLFGGYLDYQRLKWDGFYAGGNTRYASGHLNGKTSSGASLKSTADEFLIEGYLGWTLGLSMPKPVSITPYAGYGYFRSSNAFRAPSPLICRFEDTYEFPLLGISAAVYWNPSLSFGVNFKGRWMQDAQEKISGDEEIEEMQLGIGDNWLYALEFPLTYDFTWSSWCWNARFMPFWERRDYGGKESFPVDFIATRYTIYGIRFLLGINL